MNQVRHRRRSIRLQGYDYTQTGAYFVTLCTYKREHLFGHVANDVMVLNDAGITVADCWLAIPDHFPHVELDEFVVMPKHVHGIVVIVDSVSGTPVGGNVGAENFSPLQPSSSPQQNQSTPSSLPII